MGRFSTRGEVARRERVEYALVRCTQLSTVVSDPRSTIHGSLSPLCFLNQKKRKEKTRETIHVCFEQREFQRKRKRPNESSPGFEQLSSQQEDEEEEEEEVKSVEREGRREESEEGKSVRCR